MPSPKRVLTYSRVSTSHHDQNPDIQVQELRRYCSARGWTVVHEIVDHGFTGSTDNRPGLKRLMSLVWSREVDAVVVVKLDRLFRSLKHLVTTLDEIEALGITFVATRDNVDYSTPSGRLFVQVLGSLAEFEKSLIRERTILGLEHARSSGVRLGRPPSPLTTKIQALRSQGLSYRSICRELNCSMGVVCRALEGAPKTPPVEAKKALRERGRKMTETRAPLTADFGAPLTGKASLSSADVNDVDDARSAKKGGSTEDS